MTASLRASLLAGASILTLAIAAGTVWAQTATDTPDDQSAGDAPAGAIVLDTIVIDANASTDPTAPTSGYVVPTSQVTKSSVPLVEASQSVSVVTVDQIRDQGAQTLSQALKYSAGVLSEPYGSDPRFDGPLLRGFGADEGQFLNGLRHMRKFSAPAYELYGIERVEVLRGPSSALYGSGAPGGVINEVQKHAQFEDFSEAGAGFGSHDDAEAFFDVNRQVSDRFAYRLTGVGKQTAEQIEELTNERGYLAGAFRYDISDATQIDVLLSYQDDSPISPARVPFALTELYDAEDLRDFYVGEPLDDESDRRMANIGIEVRHELDNGWRLQQGFRYQKFDWDYVGFYVGGLDADGVTVNRGKIIQAEDNATLNLDTRLSGTIEAGGASHEITVGVDMLAYDTDTSTTFQGVNPIRFDDPDYGTPTTDVGLPFTTADDLTRKHYGIYLVDEISWGDWRPSFALRHDRVEQDGTLYRFGTAYSADRSDSQTTGRVGLSYVTAQGFVPYASYATSFEAQIGGDSAGNTLEPTRGKQVELGVKYQPTAFDGYFTAAVFDLRQTDVTVSDGLGQLSQIGEVRSQGVELEGTANLGAGWLVRGAYSYNDTEVKEGQFAGNRVVNVPLHNASLWVKKAWDNGIDAGVGLRRVGDRFGDDGNTVEVQGETLVDASVGYQRGNVLGSVTVTNIADKAYVANCNPFGCNYGEGRDVQARLTWRW